MTKSMCWCWSISLYTENEKRELQKKKELHPACSFQGPSILLWIKSYHNVKWLCTLLSSKYNLFIHYRYSTITNNTGYWTRSYDHKLCTEHSLCMWQS